MSCAFSTKLSAVRLAVPRPYTMAPMPTDELPQPPPAAPLFPHGQGVAPGPYPRHSDVTNSVLPKPPSGACVYAAPTGTGVPPPSTSMLPHKASAAKLPPAYLDVMHVPPMADVVEAVDTKRSDRTACQVPSTRWNSTSFA